MDDSLVLATWNPTAPPEPRSSTRRQIPAIIHQLWKTEKIPHRWRDSVESVRRYHPGWEYRLWSDQLIDDYVRQRHADFYPVFAGFSRNIMRADVFRYILMHDIGGLYCDLDYAFLRPYRYDDTRVLLSLECDKSFGDKHDMVANCIFASAPGHAVWRDILEELRRNPPQAKSYLDVVDATGPGLVTRIYQRNATRYEGIRLTSKPIFNPQRIHGRYEKKVYRNSGVTYGFHYGSGSWKDRWSMDYLKTKCARLLRI